MARQCQDAIVMPSRNDAAFLPSEDGRGVKVQRVGQRTYSIEGGDDAFDVVHGALCSTLEKLTQEVLTFPTYASNVASP